MAFCSLHSSQRLAGAASVALVMIIVEIWFAIASAVKRLLKVSKGAVKAYGIAVELNAQKK